jgi:hypothetical protein
MGKSKIKEVKEFLKEIPEVVGTDPIVCKECRKTLKSCPVKEPLYMTRTFCSFLGKGKKPKER